MYRIRLKKLDLLISQNNKTRDMHANLLMITDGYGNWHDLALQSIPALLGGLHLPTMVIFIV